MEKSEIIANTEKRLENISCSLCRGKLTKFEFQDDDDMVEIMNLLAFKK